MVRYETMFIVNSELGEEAVNAIAEKFKSLIEANAESVDFKPWAERKLEYPIDDFTRGNYYLAVYKAAPEFPAELERNFRITDGVLRFITINKDAE